MMIPPPAGSNKGAFTGAIQDREGAFVSADSGILFLDEVAELPLDVQAKFLRGVEDGWVTPEGSDRPRKVDVRAVAATNRDLPALIRKGGVRSDLYHRLDMLLIRVPPLREHVEDVEHLRRYDWPGNVRQLIKVLKRSVYLGISLGDAIDEERRLGPLVEQPDDQAVACPLWPLTVDQVRPMDEAKRDYAARALDLHGGNRAAIARALGVAAPFESQDALLDAAVKMLEARSLALRALADGAGAGSKPTQTDAAERWTEYWHDCFDLTGDGLLLCARCKGLDRIEREIVIALLAGALSLVEGRVSTQLLNCFVGETEKRIARLFALARTSRAVLLLDEADALLSGRDAARFRREVLQVSVLLGELECFDGVCMLATNRKAALDPALERRVSIKVEFEPPDRAMRRRIWELLLSAQMPLAADVDLDALAAAELTGGEIKNVVLNVARATRKRRREGESQDADSGAGERHPRQARAISEGAGREAARVGKQRVELGDGQHYSQGQEHREAAGHEGVVWLARTRRCEARLERYSDSSWAVLHRMTACRLRPTWMLISVHPPKRRRLATAPLDNTVQLR